MRMLLLLILRAVMVMVIVMVIVMVTVESSHSWAPWHQKHIHLRTTRITFLQKHTHWRTTVLLPLPLPIQNPTIETMRQS
jgi:hypothetical protein